MRRIFYSLLITISTIFGAAASVHPEPPSAWEYAPEELSDIVPAYVYLELDYIPARVPQLEGFYLLVEIDIASDPLIAHIVCIPENAYTRFLRERQFPTGLEFKHQDASKQKILDWALDDIDRRLVMIQRIIERGRGAPNAHWEKDEKAYISKVKHFLRSYMNKDADERIDYLKAINSILKAFRKVRNDKKWTITVKHLRGNLVQADAYRAKMAPFTIGGKEYAGLPPSIKWSANATEEWVTVFKKARRLEDSTAVKSQRVESETVLGHEISHAIDDYIGKMKEYKKPLGKEVIHKFPNMTEQRAVAFESLMVLGSSNEKLHTLRYTYGFQTDADAEAWKKLALSLSSESITTLAQKYLWKRD